jgi:lysylphosphatidylglycerol synthetase-like protein (DUF2156 family)
MTIDKYYIRAKLFPTVLTAAPVILFFNNFIAPLYNENLANVFTTLPTITNATFSAALVFLLILLNRFCAKEVFQKIYFQDELKMPTTNHLLWEDSFFEDSIKRKIRTKIRDKYDITLLSREEEAAEETRGRKLIKTAVSQIRISLKDNPMLLDHNIHYGFFRNLMGGSLLALIFSILILIFAFIYSYQNLKLIGVLLIIVYLTPLLLSRFFIKKHGDYYSKILYEQFISLPNR